MLDRTFPERAWSSSLLPPKRWPIRLASLAHRTSPSARQMTTEEIEPSRSRLPTTRPSSSQRPGTPASASASSGWMRNCALPSALFSTEASAFCRAIRSLRSTVPPATAASTRSGTARKISRALPGRQAEGRDKCGRRRWRRSEASPSGGIRRVQQAELLGLDHRLQLRSGTQLRVQRLHVAAAGLQRDAKDAGDRLDLHPPAEAVEDLLLPAGERRAAGPRGRGGRGGAVGIAERRRRDQHLAGVHVPEHVDHLGERPVL